MRIMSRKEAIKILERKTTIPGDEYDFPQIEEAINIAIEALKQPKRKTGKWWLSDEQRSEDTRNGNYLYFCSNCLHADIQAKNQEVPYCWWCGAKMESKSK